jgi:endonuclease YncB( thermonuclease family)
MRYELGTMRVPAMSDSLQRLTKIARIAGLTLVATVRAPSAAPCAFDAQGEGRVASVIDARSFRLEDGREVRLAGIAPTFSAKPLSEKPLSGKPGTGPTALAALLAGREVRLSGDDDAPDRYGREIAFVWLLPDDRLVQHELLAQGEAIVSADISDKDCAASLLAAERTARDAKRGIWADAAVIKNTESPGDNLAGIGRFVLVEGKVLSVRQAGATTYLNFGRNWTRDFAVTIPRQALGHLAAAGLVPKSLENQRIRVRGFVEARTGPRIEVLRAGQIELIRDK